MKCPPMHHVIVILALSLSLTAFASCSDPFGFDPEPAEEEEACAASLEWLPNTPPMELFKPLPHPETECPFYRGGWQNFLIATQPDADGTPAILSYPTIDTMFEPATGPLPANRSYLGDVKQAGERRIAIDQRGNSLYYGIHANQAYADFIVENGLETREGIENADPHVFFPAGLTEFKSAWQVLEPGDEADDTYITIHTTVPTLSQDPSTKTILEDRNNPREVDVRLLALHVVFTLPGHPEFIWATFEHSDGTPDGKAEDGKRNVAPNFSFNPDPDNDPNNSQIADVVSEDPHLLYEAGTPANQANNALPDQQLVLDAGTQKFDKTTSIYRMFPASKSATTDPDDDVTSLNLNTEGLFRLAEEAGMLHPADKRGHYRLVGATWMDQPEYFLDNSALQNDLNSPRAGEPDFEQEIKENGADSLLSILAGEDRLSSTAMESFTQGPGAFANCFTCHNTQAITARGIPVNKDPDGVRLLDPKFINVSHILSQFILEEVEREAVAP